MNDLLRKLPNMNSLLEHPTLADIGNMRVRRAARDTLDELRSSILEGTLIDPPSIEQCAKLVLDAAIEENKLSLRGVINATGVVLHTNLGRAPLSTEILHAVSDTCTGYSNLEYDLSTGKRGSRYNHVESLICEIIGTEAAMVVNNNAAAMMLILATLASGKKVAISRGELVEIGGSFRVPEVIAQGGAELIEIGSTNKTKLSDYIDAVENKGAEVLLKVHTSNYEVVGFTQSVSVAELAEYGKAVGLPVVYDVGACFLFNTEPHGFFTGETASNGLKSGADIVCFSGDKLMGSSQSGIIAGRPDLIVSMKKHPLARALRPDKLTLSVLESTLRLYRFPDEAALKIPVLSMLFVENAELERRAIRLAARLEQILDRWSINVIEVFDETGGGSLPNVSLPGWAISIVPDSMSVNELEGKLRTASTPIIIRIQDETVLISVRTLLQGDDNKIADTLAEIAGMS